MNFQLYYQIWRYGCDQLVTKRTHVSSSYGLMKTRTIEWKTFYVPLKFDRKLDSSVSELPAKFDREKFPKKNLTRSYDK